MNVTGGNGPVVDVTGNNTTVGSVVARDVNGTIVKVDGSGNNVAGLNVTGGNGTVVDIIKGNGNVVDNINVTNYTGEIVNDNGTGTKEYNISPGSPDTVFDLSKANNTLAVFSINLPVDASGNFTVNINGKTYSAVIVNGSASISVSNLVGSDIPVIVSYSGDNKYSSLSKNTKISIIPIIVDNKNIVDFYLKTTKYTVCLLVDGMAVSGAGVKFTLNGKTYYGSTDAKGYAYITAKLAPGTYKVTAEYGGVKVTNKITIKHIVSAKKTTKVKKSAKRTIIKITVKGHKVKQSSNVKFTYKGKNKVMVKFGKDMKKQTVAVKFKGKTYKVKVNGKGKGTLKLTKKVAKKLRKGKKYSLKVTFKGSKLYKKVKVTVKFNGKKYKVKTNKAGVAKFKVTKKMVKKFKKGKKVKYTITYKKDTLKRFVKIK